MQDATRTSEAMRRDREEEAPWNPESSPAFWINRVSRSLLRLGDGRLRSLGFAMSYLPVMRALAMARRPLSQKELAEAVGVEQPTMAETIARLVRDGMVQRDPNPDDKRSTVISLTRLSRARFPKARAVLIESEREAMAGLSDDEKALLRDLLKRVLKNLETGATTPKHEESPMSEYRVVQDYPDPPERVWRALTDPEIVPLWTSTGQGGKPVGFAAVVGTRFKFVGKPTVGWNGVVECEVLEVREPSVLRFTWRGGKDDDLTTVTWLLEPHDAGARLTCAHTGFTGLRGFMMAKLLGSVRRKMLSVGFPAALSKVKVDDDLRSEGAVTSG